MEMAHRRPSIPHVLLFPYPAQGHINPMLKLAELLCLSGLQVTFLNTEDNHSRLHRFTDAQSRFSRFPGFRFETITDGLPRDHTRPVGLSSTTRAIFAQLQTVIKPAFREMLISHRRLQKSDVNSKITCIIADGILGFTIDVAEEVGIPCISFRTGSACCSWIYFCLPKLTENGVLPFKDDENMDRLIKLVPEMESFLRCKDLPSYCRVKELNDPGLQFVWTETFISARATAQILNTFEDIEGPVLNQLRLYWPNLYTIGPLHSLLKSRKQSDDHYSSASSVSVSSSGLLQEDRGCIAWLDSQPTGSVVFVSLGSLAVVNWEQLLELWYGLVNSGKKFLWVRRQDFIVEKEQAGEGQIPAELVEGTTERGYIVEWAPQEEVLLHPAIGGFLTHSGWNSTIETMAAGVPMICWPQDGDQQINSRYVSEVWKNGVNMENKCDRSTVEKLVRDLIDGRKEELKKSTNEVAEKARKSITAEGYSYRNFEALVEFIRQRV